MIVKKKFSLISDCPVVSECKVAQCLNFLWIHGLMGSTSHGIWTEKFQTKYYGGVICFISFWKKRVMKVWIKPSKEFAAPKVNSVFRSNSGNILLRSSLLGCFVHFWSVKLEDKVVEYYTLILGGKRSHGSWWIQHFNKPCCVYAHAEMRMCRISEVLDWYIYSHNVLQNSWAI